MLHRGFTFLSGCFIILFSLAGCILPAPIAQIPSTQPFANTNIPTTPSDGYEPTASPQNPPEGSILSGAIYFLRPDSQGNPQVWRLAPDGISLSQITNTTSGVKDFDITMNGSLAFISGGELYVQTPNRFKPELWIGIPASKSENYPSSPRWSADGRLLAYAVNQGVWIGRSANTVHLAISDVSLAEIPENRPRIRPYAWSPDGKWMLVTIDHADSSELGLLNPANGSLSLLKLTNNIPACCQAVWAAESHGILVSNPFANSLNQISAGGLWWISNGEQARVLIPPQANDGTYNYIGWPFLDYSGNLKYAFSNFPRVPTTWYPMMLYKSTLATPELRESLREEPYFIEQILWAKDGNQAVLVIPGPGSTRSSGGPLVLVSPGTAPARPLVDQANNPRWGP